MVRPQLRMVLSSLARLPKATAPAPYAIRAYRPGDEGAWCRLINDAIGGDYTEDRLRQEMAASPDFEREDLLFASSRDEPVGTAWAHRAKHAPHRVGYMHMVAVAAEHRGRGVGRALALAVLHRFRQVRLMSATLDTDDDRLPAISLYLKLGFQPDFVHDSHAARWRRVCRELGLEAKEILSEALSAE